MSLRPVNMRSVLMSINSLRTQIGHLMFLGTSLSKEQNNLKISALGVLAHSVRLLRFLTDLQHIREITVFIVWVSNKMCRFAVIKKDDPSPPRHD